MGEVEAVHARAATRRALRAAGRAARAALSEQARSDATTAVVAQLAALPELADARRVLLTVAIGDELDLAGLQPALRARGTVVLLPVTRGPELLLAEHPADGVLVPGWQGVAEPAGPTTTDPPDVVLVPALAVDRAGARLGYGGGHFDRLLAGPARDALVVGVVFACQLVEEVPTEPHDVPLDVVVTEAGVLRPGAPAARS